MSKLHLLGIYPRQLERAIDSVQTACAEHGVDEDELWGYIWQDMDELWGTEESHLSNRIVDVVFDNLKRSLNEKGVESDYYINGGPDTHFYIDGEEV